MARIGLFLDSNAPLAGLFFTKFQELIIPIYIIAAKIDNLQAICRCPNRIRPLVESPTSPTILDPASMAAMAHETDHRCQRFPSRWGQKATENRFHWIDHHGYHWILTVYIINTIWARPKLWDWTQKLNLYCGNGIRDMLYFQTHLQYACAMSWIW